MTTTNTCQCYTRKTKEICGNPAEWITVVWKGSNIYLPGFPSTGGWLTTEAAVCKMHLNNTLKRGKSLEYRTDSLATVMPEKLPFLKEDTMEDTQTENVKCHSCTDGKRYAGPIVNGVPSSVFKCYCCAGKGFMTPEDVKRDEAYHNLHDGGPEAHAPKTPRGILCGNCRKNGVEDPYHDTAAEVQLCYKRVSTFNRPKKGIKCANCHKYHATTDEVKECFNNK